MFCSVAQEMENAWNEYSQLERDVDWLKSALQGQMNRSDLSQVCGSAFPGRYSSSHSLSWMGVCGNELQRGEFSVVDITSEDLVTALN